MKIENKFIIIVIITVIFIVVVIVIAKTPFTPCTGRGVYALFLHRIGG